MRATLFMNWLAIGLTGWLIGWLVNHLASWLVSWWAGCLVSCVNLPAFLGIFFASLPLHNHSAMYPTILPTWIHWFIDKHHDRHHHNVTLVIALWSLFQLYLALIIKVFDCLIFPKEEKCTWPPMEVTSLKYCHKYIQQSDCFSNFLHDCIGWFLKWFYLVFLDSSWFPRKKKILL